jgi:D-inositol-3-phosphate glycosyltransferase
LIAGRMKCAAAYEQQLRESIRLAHGSDRITFKVEFIPDDDVEVYFKAADVLILPYTTIFQSGVLSLGYSFGIPVIAADVGSLREEIVEGETGFVCKPENAEHLASTIARYFQSPLYENLESCRISIKNYARERYSWRKVARLTADVYSRLGAG